MLNYIRISIALSNTPDRAHIDDTRGQSHQSETERIAQK